MRIHATPTTDDTAIALDVDHPNTIQIFGRDFIPRGVTLTLDEAADLHAELGHAINDARRKADPYHGKRLTIGLREDVPVGEVRRWQKHDLTGEPIDCYALYVLADLQPQDTDAGIGAILAWGEANPGHPFTFTLTDEPDDSDGSVF